MEEWNEYGEIKENLGPTAPCAALPSTPASSTTNTPSKPPPVPAIVSTASVPDTPTNNPIISTDIPMQKSTETTATSPPKDPANDLANAMRQAGFEAAKKAGDAKSKARNEALKAAKATNPYLQKLDDAGPTGTAPPTGTAETGEAKKPETGDVPVESKLDGVAATSIAEAELLGVEGEATKPVGKGEEDIEQKEMPERIPDTALVSKEVEEQGNKAISEDESGGGLKGTGQLEAGIPTAKEVEKAANQAIAEDEKVEAKIPEKESLTDVKGAESEQDTEEPGPETVQHGEAEKDGVQQLDKEVSGESMVKSAIGKHGDEKMENPTASTTTESAATDAAQILPGTHTQTQRAGDGSRAGESVAD